MKKIAEENEIENIIPIINVDAKIELDKIDKSVVEDLKQLEPFGSQQNSTFALKNIRIDSIRALSEGKHLKLTLRENNQIINAIGFNIGELAEAYKIGDKIDIAGVFGNKYI